MGLGLRRQRGPRVPHRSPPDTWQHKCTVEESLTCSATGAQPSPSARAPGLALGAAGGWGGGEQRFAQAAVPPR